MGLTLEFEVFSSNFHVMSPSRWSRGELIDYSGQVSTQSQGETDNLWELGGLGIFWRCFYLVLGMS